MMNPAVSYEFKEKLPDFLQAKIMGFVPISLLTFPDSVLHYEHNERAYIMNKNAT